MYNLERRNKPIYLPPQMSRTNITFFISGAVQACPSHLEEAVQRAGAVYGWCQCHYPFIGSGVHATLALIDDPGNGYCLGGLCSHRYAFQISHQFN